MGNSSTKEMRYGVGHPARFYDGCTSAEGGAYTLSEIFFNQAIASHPGHAFWTRLMEVAIAKEKHVAADAEGTAPDNAAAAAPVRKSPSPGADALPTVLWTVGGTEKPAFREGDAAKEGECGVANSRQATTPPPQSPIVAAGDDANMSLNGSAVELDSKPTLVLPVDHRLADVQDYVRMLTDIGRIYRRKAADSTGDSREMACRLSMLYNAYTAVRLQALLTVFRGHFATLNTEGDVCDADVFQLYAQRAMNAQWGNSGYNSSMKKVKSVMGEAEVKVGSQYRSGEGNSVDDSHDGDVCMLWQFVQYFMYLNQVSYTMSALRLLHSEDYIMSPATQRAVLEMALRCSELMEDDLAQTAEANVHTHIGGVTKKYLHILAQYCDECRPREETVTKFGTQRRGHGKAVQRAVKHLKPKHLRLGEANLAAKQQTFLRTAMQFPVMTLPLLDLSRVVEVDLQLEHSGGNRPSKLLTPLDRSYGWYMAFAEEGRYERHSEGPGDNPFLLQRCGVPPKATLKDVSLFPCVGLEELATTFFLLALARAVVLHGMDKTQMADELGKASNSFAMELYGAPTSLSGEVAKLFEQMDNDATT